MSAPKPTIYLIAGCNGAGKTTFAKEFLPHEVKCLRFYNADELARGLSPLDPPAAAMKASRMLLAEIRQSISRKETFVPRKHAQRQAHIRIFELALAVGYEIELHYRWGAHAPSRAGFGASPKRTSPCDGGHPPFKIPQHLNHYLPLATRWAIWDSRGFPTKRLATSAADDIDSVRQLIDL